MTRSNDQRVAPRVAEPDRPDLGMAAVDERVVGGDAVRPPARRLARIDAQHLPEPGAHVLGPVLRIATAAAIAEADVEVAVGPEDEVTAVVVRVRLRLLEQGPLRRGIGSTVGPERELVHVAVAVGVGVVHVQMRTVGRDRQAEHAPLAPSASEPGEIDHGCGVDGAVADRHDATAPLCDVQRLIADAGRHRNRSVERRDGSEGERRVPGVRRRAALGHPEHNPNDQAHHREELDGPLHRVTLTRPSWTTVTARSPSWV